MFDVYSARRTRSCTHSILLLSDAYCSKRLSTQTRDVITVILFSWQSPVSKTGVHSPIFQAVGHWLSLIPLLWRLVRDSATPLATFFRSFGGVTKEVQDFKGPEKEQGHSDT